MLLLHILLPLTCTSVTISKGLLPVTPNVTLTSDDVYVGNLNEVVVRAGDTFEIKCTISTWMPGMEMDAKWRKFENQELDNGKDNIQ